MQIFKFSTSVDTSFADFWKPTIPNSATSVDASFADFWKPNIPNSAREP